MSKRKRENEFKHGNYNRYYGYRNLLNETDKRVVYFKKEWFKGKHCLDVGCNVGHLTLWLAKNYQPFEIKGVDIDSSLIKAAKSNIVHYIGETLPNGEGRKQNTENNTSSSQCCECSQPDVEDDEKVERPFEVRTFDGAGNHEYESEIEKKTCINCSEDKGENCAACAEKDIFPGNVKFIVENYAPASSDVLKYTKELYDIILCLSVTKWVQLNSGDQGLKLMFQKMHKQLRPGGVLVLEPQPFKSYKRRKNLSKEIRCNYDEIKLKPEHYTEYLLSEEVGFTCVEKLGVTSHEKSGFQRPIYLYRK